MAKGYRIARINVTNPDEYKKYVSANGVAFEKYGGRFVVGGGAHETRRGAEHQRHVVLEFDSYDVAKACYDRPEYQAAAVIRNEASEGYVVVIKGYDG